MKRIGLALGSGGAKGLAHIEFLKVFDELGIRPAMIAGTSMGALLGAFYSSGMSALEIENLYKNMKRSDMAKLIDIGINQKHGVVKGHKLVVWIRKKLKCQNFYELKIPLKVVATDFWRREQVVISKGNVADAVRASISLPGVFIPVKKGKKVLVDGGLVNPVPYDLLTDHCDTVIAIDVFGKDKRIDPRVPNIIENLMYSVNIMYNTIEKSKSVQPDYLIEVSVNGVRTLDFHKYTEVQKGVEGQKAELKRFLKNL